MQEREGVSPLLANIYLHYVFDLWVQHWRTTQTHSDMIVVRYADDFIVGFQDRSEAERFLAELKERFQKFHLELHPDKTRWLEFGPLAAERGRRSGRGKPALGAWIRRYRRDRNHAPQEKED